MLLDFFRVATFDASPSTWLLALTGGFALLVGSAWIAVRACGRRVDGLASAVAFWLLLCSAAGGLAALGLAA